MANRDDRWEDNAPGAFYVDKSCTLCNLCTEIAPDNFAEAESGDHVRVTRQPGTDGERTACEEALAQCPCGAVGNDGD